MIFVKTIVAKGKTRVVPLSGQKNKAGEPLDVTKLVQADQTIRGRYPVETIFAVEDIIVKPGYYESIGDLKAVLAEAEAADKASPEVFEEYKRFIGGDFSGGGTSTPEPEPVVSTGESYLGKLMKRAKFAMPTIEADGFYVDPDIWWLLVRNYRRRINTILLGPTGSGKTELVQMLSSKVEVPLHDYDMGSMFDPVAGLLGVHRLEKGGVSVFDYARFTTDIQHEGNILLDELSRAPVTTNNILFPCLDGRRSLPVELAGGEDLRAISVDADVWFVATANIGSEYTGTMEMDAALMNRFFPIELDYMPKEVENKVLTARTKVTSSVAGHITGVATHLRNLAKQQEIAKAVSTRETLMAAHLVADGFPLIKAMELVFLPLYEGSMTEGERADVKKVIATR